MIPIQIDNEFKETYLILISILAFWSSKTLVLLKNPLEKKKNKLKKNATKRTSYKYEKKISNIIYVNK